MRQSLTIFLLAYERFSEDDGWAISSHIALSILTSMFPFLIFLTSLAGFFGSKELADQATALLFAAWPQQVAAPISAEIHNVLTQSRGGLLTIGVVLAIYFSSSAVEALRIGLNRAYNMRDQRPWWWLRLESIAYVLVGAIALLALGFLVVLAPLIWNALVALVPELASQYRQVTVLRYLVTAVVLAASLTIAHKFLAAGRRKFRLIWPGVALTFIMSLVFAEVFAGYLAEFSSNYITTYAGLASVMIALVFLYTLAAIFVFGAELNAVLMGRRKRADNLPSRARRV